MKKKVGGENQWFTVLRFNKRIGILYLVWFLIDSPYIIANKDYFRTMGIVETVTCFLKDLFLSSTFPGSWFLSALVVSVVLVYGLSRVIGKWPVLVISLLISIYIQGQELFPESWHGAYDWYAANIRKDVVCSFPFALVWVSMGQVLASLNAQKDKEKALMSQCWLWCGLGIVYFIMVLTGSPFYWKYLLVVLLFSAFFRLDIETAPVYKRMRNASILVFLFHFSIAGKKSLFLNMLGVSNTAYHILYYLLVVLVSLIFAFTVLWLEKYKLFKWLRYTH